MIFPHFISKEKKKNSPIYHLFRKRRVSPQCLSHVVDISMIITPGVSGYPGVLTSLGVCQRIPVSFSFLSTCFIIFIHFFIGLSFRYQQQKQKYLLSFLDFIFISFPVFFSICFLFSRVKQFFFLFFFLCLFSFSFLRL